uniref:TolC family protein n=1 Tax=Prevotella sp. GTC17262 TaxID=3236797 RepID=A0AB33JGY8_9BACT
MIGAILGAGASLASGIMNANSVKSTNRTNLQIAREQNQFNLEQWKREVAYNDARWNAQNEYNSPEQQMQRYAAAGINPFMAVSNISAGNSESLTAPRGTPAAGATMQPTDYSFINNAASNAVNMYYQIKSQDAQIQNLEEQTRKQRIENTYLGAMRSAELKKLGLDSQAVSLENEYSDRTMESRIFAGNLEKDNAAASYFNLMEDVELKKTQNEINRWSLNVEKPQQLALAIQQTRSILALQKSQTDLNDKQSSLVAKQILKVEAEKLGIDLNNEVLDKSVDFLIANNAVKEMDAGVHGSGISAKNNALDKVLKFRGDRKYVHKVRNWNK